MKNALICGLATLLAACATPTTGVVPLSEGLAKVTRQGNGAWVTTADLKAQGIQEADAYCRSQKRTIQVIDVKETPVRPFGGWPEADVLFRCNP